MQLNSGTKLQGGKYEIVSVLGQGGFGITYLANQVNLGRHVAIKEFFMKEYCNRDKTTSHISVATDGGKETVARFREKFIREAKNIASLDHQNIVRVIDVFDENDTSYYVMEYVEYGSLLDKVKAAGFLSEQVALRYIRQVANALGYMHNKNLNHLDVKPANIMINAKDEAVLIDFGLSKHYNEKGGQTSTTPVGVSEGFAPLEQYDQGGVGRFSPETDIYSLGATLFKLLTGNTPPSASSVHNCGLPVEELKARKVTATTIKAITQAMMPRRDDRPKNIRQFLALLDGKENNTTKNQDKPENEGFITGVVIENDDDDSTRVADYPSGTPKHPTPPTPLKPQMPTQRKKSKLWIVFVIIGAIVTTAIIFIIAIASNLNVNNDDFSDEDDSTWVGDGDSAEIESDSTANDTAEVLELVDTTMASDSQLSSSEPSQDYSSNDSIAYEYEADTAKADTTAW